MGLSMIHALPIKAMRLKKIVILSTLLLGTIALNSCNETETPEGRYLTVKNDNFQVKVTEVGVVEARRVLPIVAPYRGKLIKVPDTGDYVEKDELIVVLEDEEAVEDLDDKLNEIKTIKSELEASIETLKIAMRSNSLDLDQAESQLEFNRIRLEDVTLQLAETEVLLQQSVVPEDDLRQAQSNTSMSRLNTMTRDLDMQSQETTVQTDITTNLSRIEQSRLEGDRVLQDIQEAREEIESAKIKAPVSGLFQRTKRWDWRQNKMVEPKPGDDLRRGQMIGEIPDLDTLVVKSQVPERELLNLKTGAVVKVKFDAYDGVTLNGEVSKIGKIAIERQASPGGSLVETETRNREKVFEIEVSLQNPPGDLKPGITATVEILLQEKENVIAVPFDAINAKGNQYFVNKYNAANKTTEKIEIQPGIKNESQVVINSGLQTGDRIFIPSYEGANSS